MYSQNVQGVSVSGEVGMGWDAMEERSFKTRIGHRLGS